MSVEDPSHIIVNLGLLFWKPLDLRLNKMAQPELAQGPAAAVNNLIR
jgi:hypothetical protein